MEFRTFAGLQFPQNVTHRGGNVGSASECARGSHSAVRLYGDYFGVRDIRDLEAVLVGCRHCRETVSKAIAHLPINEYIHGVAAEELTNGLF